MQNSAEFLYFRTNNYMLNGNTERAYVFANLLKQEMAEKGWEYKDFLSSRHSENAETVISNAILGMVLEKKETADQFEEIKIPKTTRVKKEIELQQMLFDNNDLFSEVWGKKLTFKAWEDRTDAGRVDLLYKDEEDNSIVPVELKDEAADHKVVSQILKYTLYYRKLCIYKLWDWVHPAVVAAGYDKYSINRLKMEGVRTFIYSYNKKLRLEEV